MSSSIAPRRTAFLTGGTGFLGLHIAEQLTGQGFRVVALHRKTSNVARLRKLPLELAEGSLEDRASIERAIPDGCDAVFHVAGNTSLWRGGDAQQTKDNVEGTHNVVEASLAKNAKRLVLTSSQAAFGHQKATRIDETAPSTALDSKINYMRTKYLGEVEVEKGIGRGLSAVIMNPGHIIGRYDATGWAKIITLVHTKKLPGIPPGAGTFADAGEVAKAHITAVDKGRVGERYLLGGTDATFLEMVTIIGALTGRKVPKGTMPLFAIRALGRVSDWASRVTKRPPNVTPEIAEALAAPLFIDSSKATRELGFQARPLDVMLRECHAWMKAEGLLAS